MRQQPCRFALCLTMVNQQNCPDDISECQRVTRRCWASWRRTLSHRILLSCLTREGRTLGAAVAGGACSLVDYLSFLPDDAYWTCVAEVSMFVEYNPVPSTWAQDKFAATGICAGAPWLSDLHTSDRAGTSYITDTRDIGRLCQTRFGRPCPAYTTWCEDSIGRACICLAS